MFLGGRSELQIRAKNSNFQRGPEMLRRHLNFHQISHRFTLNFTNPSFQDLNGSHIMY